MKLMLALALPGQALAQAGADSDSADAVVGILDNGQMTRLADMDFGVIAQRVGAGTLTMVPQTSACSASAGIFHQGACQPARFSIRFRKHNRVRIRQMNSGTITLTGPGGATMTVTNLSIAVTDMTLQTTGGPPGSFGTYRIEPDSGIAEFKIGGRLNIGANQAAGTYTGTLNMNVLLN